MTISQQTWSALETSNEDRLPLDQIGYFRARFLNRIHDTVLSKFMEESQENGLTRAILARRLGKNPAQVTRWLAAPGNWTLETISDLLLAMNGEMDFRVVDWGTRPKSNVAHDLICLASSDVKDRENQERSGSQLSQPLRKISEAYQPKILQKELKADGDHRNRRVAPSGTYDNSSPSGAAAMAYTYPGNQK